MDKLEERLAGLSSEQKELVLRLLNQENIEVPDLVVADESIKRGGIFPVEEREVYPLSSAQKRLFILDRMGEAGDAYQIRDIRPLDRLSSFEKIETIFRKLIERHESLRTSFHYVEGEAVQKIHQPCDLDFTMSVADCRGAGDDSEISDAVNYLLRPFRLTKAPLFRVGVVMMPNERAILVTVMHHIISDGTSMSILFEEFQRLFIGNSLQPLSLTYKDYAVWQQVLSLDKTLENQRGYWLDEFSGFEPMNPLPSDFPRPKEQDFSGASAILRMTHQELLNLDQFAGVNGATLNIVMLTALFILHYRLGCGEDIVLGIPVAGRNDEVLQGIVGMFVNTLAYRFHVDGSKKLKDLLKLVKQKHVNALENQDFPFEDLVDALEIPRDTGRNPLFDIMFAWQEFSGERGGDVPYAGVEIKNLSSRFDMTWNVFPNSKGLDIQIEYANGLFLPASVERFGGCFRSICLKMVANPDVTAGELDIVSQAERKAILYKFNNTESKVPNQTIIHLFEQQATLQPEAVALISGESTLTYRELLHQVRLFKSRLRNLGIESHHIVGLMLPRSPELMIGLLGIFSIGAVYLPMEPGYPPERIAFIKNDSGMRLCIDAAFIRNVVDGDVVQDIGDITSAAPGDLAYIIYTSGSTGLPKGVAVRHASIFNRLYWLQKRYPLGPGDVVLQKTTIVFDVSVGELLGWIIGGATLCMLRSGGHLDLPVLVAEIIKRRISAIHFVPSMMKLFLEYMEERNTAASFRSLRQVWSSGEALDVDTVNRFRRIFTSLDTKLLNLYGPTEAAVEVSFFDCSGSDILHSVPIGKPIDNVSLAIVNNHFRLCPIGVPGEILIGGVAVAEGYINQPDLTSERFIDSPLPGFPRQVYRSGDLGRFLPDGNIQYLGRIDRQLKLRGFRIEPGEIRMRILRYEGISDAVVVLAGEKEAKMLCAYLVASGPLNLDDLNNYLSLHLPAYMVPSHLITIDKIPLTVNGKLDKKALPPAGINKEETFELPLSNEERALAAIWAGVLEVGEHEIGRGSNFFSLGGNSLKAMVLANRVEQNCGVELPLVEIFKYSQLKDQSNRIGSLRPRTSIPLTPLEKRDYYPVSDAQRRLYIEWQMDRSSVAYNMPLVISLGNRVEEDEVEWILKHLLRRHASLRTYFQEVCGEPMQRIAEGSDFQIHRLGDITNRGELRQVLNGFVQPFDLSSAPLFRCALVSVDGDLTLLLDFHHIVVDGASIQILEKEFVALVNREVLPPLPVQYRDFAVWQRKMEQSGGQTQERFWLNALSGGLPITSLPQDFPRPQIRSFEGGMVSFPVEPQVASALRMLCSRFKVTMFMMIEAISAILFARLSDLEDVVLGTVIRGRNHPDLERIVGMFVNTLPLRMSPKGEKRFGQFLTEVASFTLEAFENQDVPFERLVEKIWATRDASRHPLFDIMVELHEVESLDSSCKECGGDDLEIQASKFDITLIAIDDGRLLEVQWGYNRLLFQHQSIVRFQEYFETILHSIIKDSNIPIKAIDVFSDMPHTEEIVCWPDGTERRIDQWFSAAARQFPGSIAIISADRRTRMNFQDLDRASSLMARELKYRGLEQSTVVAVLMDASIDLVIAILGVLKAGAAFLPLDHTTPASRIEYILRDSGARFMISRSSIKKHFSFDGELLLVDQLDHEYENVEIETSAFKTTAPAYIIYTSGTTGRPKGVVVSHENLSLYTKWIVDEASIGPEDKTMLLSSFAYDLGYTAVFSSLLSGGGLMILDRDTYLSSEKVIQAIKKENISYIKTTPSLFSAILHSGYFSATNCASLRLCILGGEPINVDDVEQAHQLCGHIHFINHYGPTEATIGCVFHHIDTRKLAAYKERPVIGRPIRGMGTCIVSPGNHLRIEPSGKQGELAVAGSGVALGYLNRPELTHQQFPEVGPWGGRRLYLTGDLALRLPDGHIQLAGRIGNQVKIRGFRVELEEIEAQLRRCSGVMEGAVITRQIAGGIQLVAYLAPKESIDIEIVKRQLKENLPDYMIPQILVLLDCLPLTANNKVDRKALPDPEFENEKRNVKPRNNVELRLATLWASVLKKNIDEIGIDMDFFDMGGQSLKATILSSQIHKEFHVRMSLPDIFKSPSIRQMAQFVKHADTHIHKGIAPGEKREYYPLSSAQTRLFILQQFDPDSVAYNRFRAVALDQAVECERIQQAFEQLLQQHESLRTSFLLLDSSPVQRVHDEVPFSISRKRFSNLNEAIDEFVQPFDLSEAPLLRTGIVELPEGRLVLLVDMHHIITDGISQDVMVRDFLKLYDGEPVEDQSLQYRDFAMWQNGDEFKLRVQDQTNFWLKQLYSPLPLLDLPTDYPRPLIQRFEGRTVNLQLKPASTYRLRGLLREADVTLFMALLAVYFTWLFRLTGQEDIITGIPVAGRPHHDLQGILGMFVNTIPIRSFPEGDTPFFQFLGNTRVRALEAFDNQDVQFEELVELLDVARDAGRNPLFDASFNVLNYLDVNRHSDTGTQNELEISYENRVAKFDISCTVVEEQDHLQILFQYSSHLFKESTIHRYINYFESILLAILDEPQKKLKELAMVSVEEQRQILHQFNKPVDEMFAGNLCQLFEERELERQDNIAVVYKGEALTYGELGRRARKIATALQRRGVGAESIVALHMTRSLALIESIFGILFSGGAYLPLDLELPVLRKHFMMADSNASVILTSAEACVTLPDEHQKRALIREEITEDDIDFSPYNSQLAYIIYTSGTTGFPKGVMIEHRSVANLVAALKRDIYGGFQSARVALLAPVHFDASVKQIFPALLGGHSLAVVPENVKFDREGLVGYLSLHAIEVSDCTPALLQLLLEEGESGGARLPVIAWLIGGDVLDKSTCRRLWAASQAGETTIYNVYGPTECTDVSSFFKLSPESVDDVRQIPIGKPITNARILVQDRFGNLQPPGLSGELSISGIGTGRGYLNNPELTQQKFFDGGTWSYRTGDLARWRDDGHIEYLGRIDHQVKIRGYRIELSEIEHSIQKMDGVSEVLVVSLSGPRGDQKLAAYVVLRNGGGETSIDSDAIRQNLETFLPGYMIPGWIEILDMFPLTSNGKIDRAALPLPQSEMKEMGICAPIDTIERTLLSMWAELLGIDEETFGSTDDFFRLGGHSLKAMILTSRIQKEFRVKIPLAELFRTPTIKGLARFIRKKGTEHCIPIAAVEKKDFYPLSATQKRFFLLHQMMPETTAYNISHVVRLQDDVRFDLLEKTLKEVVRRYETLRTSFVSIQDQPVQRVSDLSDFQLQYLTKEDDPQTFIRPFDLSVPPLIRAAIFKSPQGIFLLVDMHHIVSDGVSIAVLEEEILSLYNGSRPATLDLQYRDYAEWSQIPAQKERIERSLDFWRDTLSGDIPALNLPFDFHRPSVQNYEGRRLYFDCSMEQSLLIETWASRNEATMFMAVLTLFYVFLARLSGQEDFIIGTPVAGREHADLERMVGSFVNTLPLRGKPVGTKSLSGFFTEVKADVVASLEHQRLPFEELVDRLDIPRDPGRNPLFDVMFAFHNIRDRQGEAVHESLDGEQLFIEHMHSRFDMTWSFSFIGKQLVGTVEYASSLFRPDTVQRFVNFFKTVVDCLSGQDDLVLAHIELLSAEEKRRQIEVFNRTSADIPSDVTVLDLILGHYHENPKRMSLAGPSILQEGATQLTYGTLVTLASQVAFTIRKSNLQQGSIVPIISRHCVEMVAAALGIMMAGGVFLPIDPDTPPERIRWMVADCGASILLTHSAYAGQNESAAETFLLDNILSKDSRSESSPLSGVTQEDPAYVIYTSGTSGRPKGVLVEHLALLNLCLWHRDAFSVTCDDRASKLAGFGFDASVWEIFPYLAAGSSLVIVPEHLKLDPKLLNDYFERLQVTIAFLPTPLCEAFLEFPNHSLRILLTGGDKLKRMNPNQYQLINNYGPTENTVVTTSFSVDDNFSNIPIGKPIWNQQVYICDHYGNVQPVGIAGELWVGGKGLAVGYLNQPELTSESFIHGNLDGNGDVLIYKTADSCRWLPDGNIEFLGRQDDQVQIRGFRIELAEIEQAMLRSGVLKNVAVVCHSRDDGESYLAAYIVKRDIDVAVADIRHFLEGQLPYYMIPSFMIPLASLPMTANGKIDRKLLPAPDLQKDDSHHQPQTPLELQLQRIWAGVLQFAADRIGLDSDFFALGGHSLKATTLAGRIHKELHVELKLVDIFQYPTIRRQAALIRNAAPQQFSEIEPLEQREYYPLSPAQKRLYILQQFDHQSMVYNIPMLIPISSSLSEEKISAIFTTLIRRHESLRTSFVAVDDIPVQRIHATVDFSLEPLDSGENSRDITIEDMFSHFIRPFDLAEPPLLRVGMARKGESGGYLLLDMHHIISDGTSVEILERECIALAENRELPALDIHYKDYANWLQTGEMKQRIERQEAYWLNRFAGWPPQAELPIDFPRPSRRRFSGQSIRFRLEESALRGLEHYSRECGLTTFMALLSCLTILMAKLTGWEDVVIGTAVSGRRHADIEALVGMFVNTLALRQVISGDLSLRDYTETIKQNVLEDFDHQDFPFETLVDRLRVERNTGRNPLFDVMLSYRDIEGIGDSDSPANVHGVSRFDMCWNFYGSGERLDGSVEFSDELFSEATVQRFIGYFSQIAVQLMDARPVSLKTLDMLPEYEKKRIVEYSKGEEFDVPPVPLHEMVRRLARQERDRIAVEMYDSYITYGELDRCSDRLAASLRRYGVCRECMAALYLHRSLEMLVAILGILKSGAAYVPLDPDYPDERLAFILNDCGAAILLVAEHIPSIALSSCEIVDIHVLTQMNENGAENETQPHDPAYVIYTSGTTGKPKGVVIEHRSVVNLALYQARRFSIETSDRILQFSSYCFDASVEQIFIALFSGAGLVMIDRGDILDIERFHHYITQKQVTHIHAVPSFLSLVHLSGSQSVKRVVSGGDICPPALVNYFTSYCDFFNKYGPTETTVTSIEARFTGHLASHSVAIGRPLGNTQVYILDQYGHLVPDGVIGELFIAGAGVGRGYINRPQLTAGAFQPDHISGHGKMYRTGDFCRRGEDGTLEFLGRRDSQIKVRGFRIEAGEIEHILLEHESVKDALIVSRENKAGEANLIGYLVLEADADASYLDHMRAWMKDRLPAYMIPTVLIPIDTIPLNANGKVDPSQLPAPEFEARLLDNEPATSLEKQLQMIWSEILSLDEDQIGRNSDFFSIGGHSLNATILAGRIHHKLSVSLPLVEIFNHPTIGQMAELIAASTPERFAHIQPLEKQDYYRMSPSQTRLFFLQQLDRANTVYNMPMAIPLGDSFLFEDLQEVFQALIQRHESLRTSFIVVNDRPVQRIHDTVEFQIDTYSKQNIAAFVRPFDLSQAPLLRMGVADGFLLVDMHHIISDGVSLQVLEKECIAIMQNRPLPRVPIQYKDYAAWCCGGYMKTRLTKQQDYWLQLYADGIPEADLPVDFPRSAILHFSGDIVRFDFDKKSYEGFEAMCHQYGITVFMALSVAFSILLSKLSGQEDVVMGTVVSGRRHIDVERMIGVFVNSLALRLEPHGETSLDDYIEIVRDRLLMAFDNQDFPFEDLVDKLQPERKPGRNPLFDVMIEHHDGRALDELDGPLMDHRVSRFDMSWTFVSHAEGIRGSVEFSDELYRRDTIERFVHYLQTIVSQVVSGSNPTLKDIDVVGEKEKQRILNALAGENAVVPHESLHVSFQRQASLSGDRVALELADETLTYGALDGMSNNLATELIQRGAGPGTLIAVCMERSLQLIVSLVGILKSGSAYVPLDPTYPSERLLFVVRDCAAVLTLISPNDNLSFPNECQTLAVEAFGEFDEYPAAARDIAPDSPAYVIYTSGTTGKPKGVMVEHHSIVNLINAQTKNYNVNCSDRIVQFSSASFDASLEQIFLALSNGAALLIATKDTILDVQHFTRFIMSRTATHLDSVPSYLALLELPTNHSLRRIIAGGEACPPALAERLGSRVEFFNAYGPTETTVTSLTGSLNIGTPIENIHAYIWDRHGKLSPTGVAGELIIGGSGVARGYLNRPELTHECFGPDPYYSPGRVYRSGDLCRLNLEGEVEFIGRKDSQVKIRGNRVEPLEIRQLIMAHDAVKDAAVICGTDDAGEAILVGYVVLAGEPVKMEQIRQYLKQKVPSFMIPSYLIPLEAIPLNSNGKLDVGCLPRTEFAAESRVKLPANQTEEILVDIWADVLGLERAHISTDADFFSLGGHSLKATMLVSRIRSELKADVPLNEIFKTPTIIDISTYIGSRARLGNVAESKQLVPLKFNADQLPNLFFIHDGLGQVAGYRELCEYLDHNFNYWGVQTKMTTIESLDKKTLKILTDEHVETIQSIQEKGPYYIAGWSMGGAIAFSISKKLENLGYEVRFLGLIDAGIPKEIFNNRNKLKGNLFTFHAGKENLYDLDPWSLFCGGDFKSHYITGDHHSILTFPEVLELANKFKQALKKT